MRVAVSELAGGLLPAEQVEAEIVAAGGAAEKERKDGEQGGERNKEKGQPIARHEVRVAHMPGA